MVLRVAADVDRAEPGGLSGAKCGDWRDGGAVGVFVAVAAGGNHHEAGRCAGAVGVHLALEALPIDMPIYGHLVVPQIGT